MGSDPLYFVFFFNSAMSVQHFSRRISATLGLMIAVHGASITKERLLLDQYDSDGLTNSLSPTESFLDGLSVKQLLHMLSNVENEFYDDFGIEFDDDWKVQDRSKQQVEINDDDNDDVLYRRKRAIDNSSTGPAEYFYGDH